MTIPCLVPGNLCLAIYCWPPPASAVAPSPLLLLPQRKWRKPWRRRAGLAAGPMSDLQPVTSHATDFILLVVTDVIRHNALLNPGQTKAGTADSSHRHQPTHYILSPLLPPITSTCIVLQFILCAYLYI